MITLILFILAVLGLVFLAKAISTSPRRAVWFWAAAVCWIAVGVGVFVLSQLIGGMDG